MKPSEQKQIYQGLLDFLFAIFIIILLTFVFFCISIPEKANAEMYDAEKIVEAIYKAEGGPKAKKPYGILSVPCHTKEECRKICYNTVVNNFTRWQIWGHEIHPEFLDFLASRYAPVNAENDPKKLNQYWLKNVKYFLEVN